MKRTKGMGQTQLWFVPFLFFLVGDGTSIAPNIDGTNGKNNHNKSFLTRFDDQSGIECKEDEKSGDDCTQEFVFPSSNKILYAI